MVGLEDDILSYWVLVTFQEQHWGNLGKFHFYQQKIIKFIETKENWNLIVKQITDLTKVVLFLPHMVAFCLT